MAHHFKKQGSLATAVLDRQTLLRRLPLISVLGIILLFFTAYSILSIVRHNHYNSFGYDLGINNQVVWRYSTFQLPVTTSDPFPTETKLATHVELVYALIAPFYWIWSSARMLLLVDAAFMCLSAIPVYLLAKKYKLKEILAIALVVSYLGFYGVQNALWFDVHSSSFAAAFLMWFLYFLDRKQWLWAWVFVILAITSKENIGLLTFCICVIYFFKRREKQMLFMGLLSLLYLVFIYLVFFPHIIQHQYLYQNKAGLLSNLNPISLVDTTDKRQALFYSFLSFGFLPIVLPLYLLPTLAHFATFFVLASDLTAAQGLSMHYRVTLAPLLVWATIIVIGRFRRLNTVYLALYLLFCTCLVQYTLHLPLSYLAKSWFWTEPSGVKHINAIKAVLPKDASVVAQNNIIPHISQRDKIYTLYPEKRAFTRNSPCGQQTCDWFRWDDHPAYLFVDTSPEWDARHLLIDRDPYIQGLHNLEKVGIIRKYRQQQSAILYTVLKRPS